MKSASLSSLMLPLLLLGQLSVCASLKLTRRIAVGSAVGAAVSQGVPAVVHALEQDGMTYEILQAGDTSSPLPQRAQQAVVDYTLWIEKFEGKQIDTSKGTTFPPKLPSPFTFAVGVGSVIKGWDKAVKTMHVGEKRRIAIPSSLGYGDKGVGPIPGGATLFFEVELLELKPLKLSAKQQEWLDSHPE